MSSPLHSEGKIKLRRIAFDLLVIFGTLYPAVVIGVELTTRMCAYNLFDPLPTVVQTALVCLVPATNFVVWLRLRKALRAEAGAEGNPVATGRLMFFSGLSIGVAALYTFLFLPVTPIAVVLIMYGLGLLPLAPLSSFVTALIFLLILRRLATAAGQPSPWRREFWSGVALAVAILCGMDAQAALTRGGVAMALDSEPWTEKTGLSILRTIGDRELLLRYCYVGNPPPSGPLSMLEGMLEPKAADTANMRLLYYRVTGEPFSKSSMPDLGKGALRAPFGDFEFDADQGAATVGGRASGLSLTGSRMDGSISGDNAAAYIEWTFEFSNKATAPREARLELGLPPQGVVTRATLWINGEEREAAYGARGIVRRAYEKVVRVQRDPLLVTSTGAGRVLAQAFPVPAGGTIKFKLGITAPLELTAMDRARLTLPTINDRNFSFGPTLKHVAWLESKTPMTSSAESLTPSKVEEKVFRLRGELTDLDLGLGRPVISVERDAGLTRVWAPVKESGQVKEGRAIIQEIVPERRTAPSVLLVVVDGSLNMKQHAEAVAQALAGAPAGAKVGLMIAGEQNTRFAPAEWTGAHKNAVLGALRSAAFVGGQDNASALADALLAVEPYADGRLLWVHAAQPVAFQEGTSKLEQTGNRIARRPEVWLYAVEPGRSEALPDAPWAWQAHTIAATGSVEADLKGFMDGQFGASPKVAIQRSESSPPASAMQGSEHIVRLWAQDQVLALMNQKAEAGRGQAIKLAMAHRLVTPVTGAVVLETKKQFDDDGLEPAQDQTVPAVPEARTWLMLALAGGLLGWAALRRRPRRENEA